MINKIPKILHFIWLGENKKPKRVLDYIESWKKFCPDYEIKEWNDEILKEIDNQFAKEAYDAKKYAFASDYIRLYVLKKYGGIYLDTDVELTHSLDEFLCNEFFTGYHKVGIEVSIATNLFGAIQNCEIINSLLAEYDNKKFITEEGKYDMTPNPAIFKNLFENKYGCDFTNGENTVELKKNCLIYPHWFFSVPKNNQKSYAIHHFMRSWHKENLSIKDWIFSKHKYSTTHYMIIVLGIKIKIKQKK